jgi:hypothetical protein
MSFCEQSSGRKRIQAVAEGHGDHEITGQRQDTLTRRPVSPPPEFEFPKITGQEMKRLLDAGLYSVGQESVELKQRDMQQKITSPALTATTDDHSVTIRNGRTKDGKVIHQRGDIPAAVARNLAGVDADV